MNISSSSFLDIHDSLVYESSRIFIRYPNAYHCYFILGNDLTFSPSTPLCIGEEVNMTCFVVPPTSQVFIDFAALISFNGSVAGTISNINDNTLGGIDTSRYTAGITGLTVSTDRPGIRLTITDYQASDGATNFSCHGLYSGAAISSVIISGIPQRLAS